MFHLRMIAFKAKFLTSIFKRWMLLFMLSDSTLVILRCIGMKSYKLVWFSMNNICLLSPTWVEDKNMQMPIKISLSVSKERIIFLRSRDVSKIDPLSIHLFKVREKHDVKIARHFYHAFDKLALAHFTIILTISITARCPITGLQTNENYFDPRH